MQNLRIYHNPRCSKSRQTLALLTDKGLQPEIIEYLKTPLSVSQIEGLMALLNIEDPRKMMRLKEKDYTENNLGDENVTASQLISAMATYPKLIERPIVVNNNQARIGRPPESVLDIL
ncbi:arsenate reductase (glutaredoxin) [Aliiglaciecola sp. 3_MG-2023]|uniref:arsenate reductase (glutaredoxin) n=1 Tax=Aliiglaciecola sp. 3_MG-2023 TaxID=3062644 RepID=UPI0026E14241|nr:arsenate reductase (glutaredoxin) [Aliiglaciecola sp. 3_MG-2023]MDO6693713.1 arsenate reductase (glutaredoxin) [Aliiglaciecola sp. 3_MG-2023]